MENRDRGYKNVGMLGTRVGYGWFDPLKLSLLLSCTKFCGSGAHHPQLNCQPKILLVWGSHSQGSWGAKI